MTLARSLNREIGRAAARRYYAEHRAECIERCLAYYYANHELRKAVKAAHYQKNREAINAAKRARHAAAPEKERARKRAWAAGNPEKVAAARARRHGEREAAR